MTVIDGPFAESKELVAGYIVIEVDSIEEAIHWARRCPSTSVDCRVEMEVRQVISVDDFAENLRPSLTGIPWTSVSQEAAARQSANASK
jgi:hypothetical protein